MMAQLFQTRIERSRDNTGSFVCLCVYVGVTNTVPAAVALKIAQFASFCLQWQRNANVTALNLRCDIRNDLDGVWTQLHEK